MITPSKLTRALIETGGVHAMVAHDAPDLHLLTDAERAASLAQTLACRPPGDVWLFGYGSLIWNPIIPSLEQRPARIQGWHRAFCLAVSAGRGSAAQPGLVLGLDAGGSCAGVAFRLAEEGLEAELALLWQREMLAGSYVPRWLDLFDAGQARFASAIAFTVDPTSGQYAGGLTRETVVQRLATASGGLGTAAEYLFQTCDGLRMYGIPDLEMERLAASVAAAQCEARGHSRIPVVNERNESPVMVRPSRT